jgi:hypothetical protein
MARMTSETNTNMHTNSNDFIYLPVSLGEAMDKLTILDIKLDKIKDTRRNDVQHEYDLLHETLTPFLIKYNDLYQSMKKVNLMIWNMMDVLRDGDVGNEAYLKVCKECIEYNDIRFRVKNKINYASKSSLKEQKSYKVNTLLMVISDGINHIEDFVRPIKYYSLFYDEIVIKHRDDTSLKPRFHHDPTVVFIANEDVSNFAKNSKKQIAFPNNIYDKDAINDMFELTEDAMNSIL